jgi:uncharacterized membrane protein
MTATEHLWAIAYEDLERANKARDELSNLAWESGRAGMHLNLLDVTVVTRHPDGTFTLDRKPFPSVGNILACTTVGFLAGLVVAAPLAGAAVGALMGGAGTAAASQIGIGEDFIREVQGLMKPGTSTLFVLDEVGDLEVILHTIQGLGGTVVKTNVDREHAKLIQSTLAAPSAEEATSSSTGG